MAIDPVTGAAIVSGGFKIGGSILDYFMNKGASKAQNKAMNEMLKIAQFQAELQKKQADIDLPYRKNLFGALQERTNRQTPRFMQRDFTPSNPHRNVRKVAPNQKGLSPELLQVLLNQSSEPRGGGRNITATEQTVGNPLLANRGSTGQ